jgi:putative ABC transport system permease protein
VAVLSHRVWQGRFGGDGSIVGRSIRVNGTPTTVIGVMPPELLILGSDLWIPWGADPLTMPRNFRPLTLIGRLAPGATLAEANSELATIAAAATAAHAGAFEEYQGWRIVAVPWTTALMRDLRSSMLLLLGAVALVLLIACANLSGLALARSATRQREMAICLALGAGRCGLARQQLAEVVWLALLGGSLGLLVAYAGLPALVSLVPRDANTLGLVPEVGWRVVLWAGALTVASAIVVALLPVYQATRTSSHDALKAEGRGLTTSRGALRLRHGLIVGEIALAVVLLAGAGLLVRSFVNLQRVPLGFDADGVLTMRLTLPAERYRGPAINDFFQRLLDTLDTTAGVRDASVATQLPLMSRLTTPFRIDGVEAPADTLPTALLTVVGGPHFATLRTSMVQGRPIEAHDRAGAPRVVVVNEAFVARYLPGVTPLGRRVVLGARDRPQAPAEIVGVVANAQNVDLRSAASAEVFLPLHQQTVNNQLFLLVRTDGDAAALLPTVRAVIAGLDAEQPIYAVQTLADVVAGSQFRGRFSMALFVAFAAIALALAAVGIYGVMSQAVAARTQEIGVRLAVGADRSAVVGLVLRQVVRLTLGGLLLGLGGALALGAALRRSLFEVGAFDPATMAGVAVVLGVVALTAGWLPAWRASRVDPVMALRYE